MKYVTQSDVNKAFSLLGDKFMPREYDDCGMDILEDDRAKLRDAFKLALEQFRELTFAPKHPRGPSKPDLAEDLAIREKLASTTAKDNFTFSNKQYKGHELPPEQSDHDLKELNQAQSNDTQQHLNDLRSITLADPNNHMAQRLRELYNQLEPLLREVQTITRQGRSGPPLPSPIIPKSESSSSI